MASLDGFRLVVPLRARFRDSDGMGHVNNAVYFTYFEEARAAYFRRVIDLRSYRDVSIILARACCEFRAPRHPGAEIDVGARVESIGTKSFRMTYRACERSSSRLVAEADSIQVWYDYGEDRSIVVPEEFRRKASEFEGRTL